jgi:hypothetical protein
MDMNSHELLHAQYLAGDVCLFVGAGVSMGCGLPDWRGLSKEVVRMFPLKPGRPLGAVSAAIRQGKQPPPDPNALSIEKATVLTQEEPLLAMRYARSDGEIDLCSLVSTRRLRLSPWAGVRMEPTGDCSWLVVFSTRR